MAASSLQARREARKRRILENSENRLQKIFGNQESSLLVKEGARADIDEETHKAHLPRVNGNVGIPVISETVTNSATHHLNHPEGVNFSGADSHFRDEILEQSDENVPLSLDRLLTNQDLDPIVKEEPQRRPSTLQYVISRRLHIIILAILVRLSFAFSYEYLFGENLLLPFFVVELTEILMTDKEPSSGTSGILGAALLLSGIIPRKVSFISNIYNRTSKLLQNLCLYLFTFIIFYAILEWPG